MDHPTDDTRAIGVTGAGSLIVALVRPGAALLSPYQATAYDKLAKDS